MIKAKMSGEEIVCFYKKIFYVFLKRIYRKFVELLFSKQQVIKWKINYGDFFQFKIIDKIYNKEVLK